MTSIPPISAIPSQLWTTPVQAIRPVAPSPSGQADQDETAKPQAANPPGVGRLVDIKA